MTEKHKHVVKCEGRFHQLRNLIYEDAIPAVLEGRTTIGKQDLQNIWDLIKPDIYGYRFDIKDPYFESRTDNLRASPINSPLSLVPLIESQFSFEKGLVKDYALQMGNSEKAANMLELMTTQPRDFLKAAFEREANDIHLPGGQNLGGYVVAANYGIGTISPGGLSGGGIRSDSPFLLEVYKSYYQGPKRGGSDLVAVLGFWPQSNNLLVSQMQSCKNARFPEEIPFGVCTLRVAESAARQMGFEKILSYNARGHPMFFEHRESWGQFGGDFVAIWDNSAKKLGFRGSRNGNEHYEKSLNGDSQIISK